MRHYINTTEYQMLIALLNSAFIATINMVIIIFLLSASEFSQLLNDFGWFKVRALYRVSVYVFIPTSVVGFAILYQ